MKCKIQKPLQVAKNEDHCFQMSLMKNSNDSNHNTNKLCNFKANVGDMKKLAYTHSIICDGGSHKQQ
jgi:hypothetical protein